MTKLQRMSILNLSLAAGGLFIQVWRILAWDVAFARIATASMSFAICSGLVASYAFRRRFAKQGAQHYDERDALICKRAFLLGLIVLFFVIFAASIITFMLVGPGGAINITVLFTILTLGAMSLFFAESAAILYLYGFLGGGDNE